MKRLSILLTMCVLIIAQTTRAIVIDDGCLKFSITGGAATVISSDRYVKNIVIPDTIWDDYNKSYPVVAIGSSAFSYSESRLTSIIIPNTVRKIDNYAFFNCGNLSSVSIGSSVETIGENAFCGCASLTSIRIPYSAKSIGVNAFYGCRNLRFVDIPGTIQKMDSSAFDYSSSELVVSIYFMNLDDFSKYVQRDATSFRTACRHRIYFRENEQTKVTIPNSVTKIGANVFLQCQNITSVTIPNSVTSIGDFAFYRCSGLTSITIPSSVTSIGQDAFNGCASFTSVTIPNPVTSIGSRAFYDCNLKSLLCYAKTIPTCDGALVSDYSNCTLYVYKNSISAYKKASVWKNFTNIASIESYEWQRLLSEYETTYNANSKYNNKFPEAAAEFYAIIQNGKKKEPTTVTEEDIDELNEAYRRYLGSLGYVTRISLNESACNICIGNTLQLTAKVSPENAVDSSVSWASDNPSIATVDETGLVTAIAEGEATIMCNANDGKGASARCNITVIPHPVAEIMFSETEITIPDSRATVLMVTVAPDNAKEKRLIWRSSDPSVATVESVIAPSSSSKQYVLIHPVSIGHTTITCTAKDGSGVTASCEVYIKPSVNYIELSKSSTTIKPSSTLQLTATIYPGDAFDKSVTWSSSNPEVATVSQDGLVTAITEGETTIKCMANDGSNIFATCNITVGFVSRIQFEKNGGWLFIGQSARIPVTLFPEDAEDKSLTWTSSNPKVVSVDETGLLTSLSAGEATITCTANDGGGANASFDVHSAVFATAYRPDVNAVNTQRHITSIGLTEKGKEPQSVDISTTKIYNDLTKTAVFEVTEGSTVTGTIGYDGNWMHGYFYIDLNGDHKLSYNANQIDQTGTEVFSYSFWNGDENSDGGGQNSAGFTLTGSARNTVSNKAIALPAFTAPAAGTYNVRFKVDWNCINPAGNTTEKNGIIKNGGYTVDAVLKVNPSNTPQIVYVRNIQLSKSSAYMKSGETLQLSATISPENADDKSVTWSSSNPEVATVSQDGLVTSVAEGETTIICMANDGGNAVAYCNIIVETTHVSLIGLELESDWLFIGQSVRIPVTISPENADDKSVTWTSSNPEVVSVDETGLLTSLSAGEATITCRANDGGGASVSFEVYSAVFATNYRPSYYAINTQRHITSIGIAEQDGEPQNVNISTGKVYNDLTETAIFEVTEGSTVTANIGYDGTSMHGYFYIDLNNDHRIAYNPNQIDQTDTEVFSYSFWSGDVNNGESGQNSAGQTLTGNNRNSVVNNVITLPTFTAPAAGTYNVRFKVDWNCIDPAGNTTEKDNIIKDGGYIVDAVLKVNPGKTTDIQGLSTSSDAQTIYDLSGRRIEVSSRGLYIQNGRKIIKH